MWAEALSGLAVLAVYLRTLAPTVVGGDSGELIAVAATLGVAHPPGYPLYTLLAHAFTWLPFGGVALRVNLLSAVCGALAAALVCRAVRRATGEPWGGVLAAGALAFSPLVWPYAVTAEVFPLNDLFVAALALCVVEVERAGAARGPSPRPGRVRAPRGARGREPPHDRVRGGALRAPTCSCGTGRS